MSDFERMAWDYSDSMRLDETTKNDDIATAYAKGFMAGAKAFTAYLKDVCNRYADAGLVFAQAEMAFDGEDMFDHEEE